MLKMLQKTVLEEKPLEKDKEDAGCKVVHHHHPLQICSWMKRGFLKERKKWCKFALEGKEVSWRERKSSRFQPRQKCTRRCRCHHHRCQHRQHPKTDVNIIIVIIFIIVFIIFIIIVIIITSENATNATRDPETGVATAPGELAVTKPWKQRLVVMVVVMPVMVVVMPVIFCWKALKQRLVIIVVIMMVTILLVMTNMIFGENNILGYKDEETVKNFNLNEMRPI